MGTISNYQPFYEPKSSCSWLGEKLECECATLCLSSVLGWMAKEAINVEDREVGGILGLRRIGGSGIFYINNINDKI